MDKKSSMDNIRQLCKELSENLSVLDNLVELNNKDERYKVILCIDRVMELCGNIHRKCKILQLSGKLSNKQKDKVLGIINKSIEVHKAIVVLKNSLGNDKQIDCMSKLNDKFNQLNKMCKELKL